MPYFGILNWNLKKSVVKFFCQHRRIFRTAKFRVKTKKKINLSPKLPYLDVFGL